MCIRDRYGLKNLDFFDVGASIASTDVWPFLLAFVVLLPLFVLIERRAADPVPVSYTHLSAGDALEMLPVTEEAYVIPPVAESHPDGFFLTVSGDSMDKIMPVSYTHLDVYKRQDAASGQSTAPSAVEAPMVPMAACAAVLAARMAAARSHCFALSFM